MTKFDYMVLGGGSGGLASAKQAASLGAKVLLIEEEDLGGTCVNAGCVPKKIMWNAADTAESLRHAASYGFSLDNVTFDWAKLKKARESHIEKLNDLHANHLKEAKVTVVRGHGTLADQQTITVRSTNYRAQHILIATGSAPVVPKIEGAYHGITSDGFFELEACPRHVAIAGGGYIAAELASVLHALGSKVSVFLREPCLLENFDEMLAKALAAHWHTLGIEIVRNIDIVQVKNDPSGITLIDARGKAFDGFDHLIWAIGRKPCSDLNLRDFGIKCDDKQRIIVDKRQNTSHPGIYAIGDVTTNAALTPVAIAAGKQLAKRLFGHQHNAKLDDEIIPSVIFSHPPIGSVGLTEKEAKEQHGEAQIKVYQTEFTNMYYALTTDKVKTTIKLVTLLPEERIIGLHIFGDGADEMLQGFAVALKMGATKADFEKTLAIHPTAAEEVVTMS